MEDEALKVARAEKENIADTLARDPLILRWDKIRTLRKRILWDLFEEFGETYRILIYAPGETEERITRYKRILNRWASAVSPERLKNFPLIGFITEIDSDLRPINTKDLKQNHWQEFKEIFYEGI
ncbi:MAG: hypothetical protein R3213_07840 [Flavobacteriaceae bacterium]|nr:hypothetical protein [Flavobacteriaceae bacterium]